MILSVVVPTMNKVGLLERTLNALRGQDLGRPDPWEVVVVDDGSSDGTAAFLAGLSFPGWPSLVVVRPSANVGRARARNLGARAAQGRWLVFIDDDIVAPPGLLAAHLALLDAHPGCGTIGHAVTDPGLVDSPHFHYLDTRGVARLHPGPAPGRFFVTQNAAVPRQAFLNVGGFDENFSGYGFEDMEVAFRLEEQAGVGFWVLGVPVPVHVHHHTLDQYLAKKVECGRHSLGLLAKLHPTRVHEMRLHHAVDIPGMAPAMGSRLLRLFCDSPLGRAFPRWMGSWPTGKDHRPILAAVYGQFMGLAMLCCFRKGLTEGAHSEDMTQNTA